LALISGAGTSYPYKAPELVKGKQLTLVEQELHTLTKHLSWSEVNNWH